MFETPFLGILGNRNPSLVFSYNFWGIAIAFIFALLICFAVGAYPAFQGAKRSLAENPNCVFELPFCFLAAFL